MQASTVPSATENPELPTESLLEAFRRMTLIRLFEERVVRALPQQRDARVRAPVDRPGGVCGRRLLAAAATDVITSTHRGHGHCLAKGLDHGLMLAELMGRDTGTAQGRAGRCTSPTRDLGIFGANGIVGGGLPIAGGAALAAKLRGRRAGWSVVVLRRRRGRARGPSTRRSTWRRYGGCRWSSSARTTATRSSRRSPTSTRCRWPPAPPGTGSTTSHVDGNDVEAVASSMTDVVRAHPRRAAARSSSRPTPTGGTATTRATRSGTAAQGRAVGVAAARPAGARRRAAEAAASSGADSTCVRRRRSGGDRRCRRRRAGRRRRRTPDAAPLRRRAPRPAVARAGLDAGPGRRDLPDHGRRARRRWSTSLRDDPDVFVAGIDVGAGGNVFALTRGLYARWPDRRARHADLGDARSMGARGGRARWRACARSSS